MADATPAKQETGAAAGGGGLKLVLIISVLNFALGAAAVTRSIGLWGPPTAAAATAGHGEEGGEVDEPVLPHSTLKLEPFLVNLSDGDRHRYVKASLQVGFEEEAGAVEVGENATHLSGTRQVVIEVLGSRVAEQLASNDGKRQLREEITTRLNEIHLPAKVLEIYITDFLVQY